MNIAIIPARSGSKRINNKNIKLISGKPLISYPIECAKKVWQIDEVIVATDSQKYKYMAEQYGAKVIMRPPEISDDTASTEQVISYVLDEYISKGIRIEYIALMQATNPFITSGEVSSGFEQIVLEKTNSLVTYTDFNGFFVDDSDLLERPRTQIRVPKKLESGALWIISVDAFLERKNRICEPVSYMKLDKISSIDIDDSYDLEIATSLMERRNRIKEKSYYKERPYSGTYSRYYNAKEDPDGKVRDILTKEEMLHRASLAKNEIVYVNSLVDNNERKKILDLGCGSGAISVAFDNTFEKFGLEIPESISDMTYKTFKPDNLQVGYLTEGLYEEEFFDIVFCFHVIEHVPDPLFFIAEVNRILKTHGKLILSTPNFDCAAARRFGKNFRMLHDITHCSLFSEKGMSDILSDFGFEIEHTDFPYFETEYFTEENLVRLFDTSKVSPPFYGNIMTFYAVKK